MGFPSTRIWGTSGKLLGGMGGSSFLVWDPESKKERTSLFAWPRICRGVGGQGCKVTRSSDFEKGSSANRDAQRLKVCGRL